MFCSSGWQMDMHGWVSGVRNPKFCHRPLELGRGTGLRWILRFDRAMAIFPLDQVCGRRTRLPRNARIRAASRTAVLDQHVNDGFLRKLSWAHECERGQQTKGTSSFTTRFLSFWLFAATFQVTWIAYDTVEVYMCRSWFGSRMILHM